MIKKSTKTFQNNYIVFYIYNGSWFKNNVVGEIIPTVHCAVNVITSALYIKSRTTVFQNI